ncbi:hypothetical protein BpHYR1_035069 [Brachionus plicatilis]|uniref:Uncharacterized protein n=1 Tax=Brachionus plicatilis TaxID=10195 RepID=A0A3M7SZH9_BRAPC|nr:hypothetical protein BpHYR1_035069 [Brachionus plicatilis]
MCKSISVPAPHRFVCFLFESRIISQQKLHLKQSSSPHTRHTANSLGTFEQNLHFLFKYLLNKSEYEYDQLQSDAMFKKCKHLVSINNKFYYMAYIFAKLGYLKIRKITFRTELNAWVNLEKKKNFVKILTYLIQPLTNPKENSSGMNKNLPLFWLFPKSIDKTFARIINIIKFLLHIHFA